jgi:DedD protein
MASPAATEASEIRRRGRQRLIGAIALVLLLVVFVPMLLDKEPGRAQPVPAIPSKDNAPALPAPPPAAAAAPAKGATKEAPPEKVATVTPAPDAKLSKSMPPVSAVASVKANNPPISAPPAPPRLEGFAVQVGAFRDEAKLNQARDKLAAAKVAHFTERLDSQGGALTRLRAGPFPTREAAESAQATLKRAGLDGKVVPLP